LIEKKILKEYRNLKAVQNAMRLKTSSRIHAIKMKREHIMDCSDMAEEVH
jgi:hypothetical protein